MVRNYLLVYEAKLTGEIIHRYFDELEDMNDFIKTQLNQKRYWKILHKYGIKKIK